MICSECQVDTVEDEFYVDRSRPRGRVARCKGCYSNRQKIDRVQKPRKRFSEAKSNAAKRGILWDLTFDDYVAWLWDAPCFYCGNPAKGGIDRLNNELRYDIFNAVACCKVCNSMKGKLTMHQFFEQIQRIWQMTANAAIACGGQ